MEVYAWLIDLIHRRKNAPRGWFPGGSKKWPNTAGQYSTPHFFTASSTFPNVTSLAAMANKVSRRCRRSTVVEEKLSRTVVQSPAAFLSSNVSSDDFTPAKNDSATSCVKRHGQERREFIKMMPKNGTQTIHDIQPRFTESASPSIVRVTPGDPTAVPFAGGNEKKFGDPPGGQHGAIWPGKFWHIPFFPSGHTVSLDDSIPLICDLTPTK